VTPPLPVFLFSFWNTKIFGAFLREERSGEEAKAEEKRSERREGESATAIIY
jgi:hypothetical protein